ncbi:MAG TPA: exodeoxyribonuclease VII large subunit [Candidatus Binatia bacterium]|nr:exodeoxyribonuclease VII large subunit [Candidatus Binatia bacterium]
MADRTVLSVSDLAATLRGLVETTLPSVWVQGEVSNFRNPAGHWYLTLKDAQAQVRCAMFRNRNLYVRPQPKDGDQVLVRGQLSFYEARGDLQLILDHLEPAGEGALLRQFEELKRKLAAEGLFDEGLKRPLPPAPRGIGVITSPTGAALQDVLTTLRRRYPLGRVYVWPVPVQGDNACPSVVRALRELPQRAPVDVVLLVRGGGSLEDLWCFNHETIARAIRACAVPVVTGIGHEVDFTIADFAADLRAPTPTSAAERVAPDLADWKAHAEDLAERLAHAMRERIEEGAAELERGVQRLERTHPGRRLQVLAQRLDELHERLRRAGPATPLRRREQLAAITMRLATAGPQQRLARLHERLALARERLHERVQLRLRTGAERVRGASAVLATLDPRAVLQRGYAIVQRTDGAVVRDAAVLQPGEELRARFAAGEAVAEVRGVMKGESGAR